MADQADGVRNEEMIKNYLKIAWRTLVKHKMYSLIKIGGFAFSIAACILIGLYIIHELNYDNTYPKSNRIFRLVGEFNDKGKIMKGTSFQAPLSKVIAADFPEVEKAGRLLPSALFYGAGSNQINIENNPTSIFEEGFTYADQEILDILELPMVYGKRADALASPRSVVMTKSKSDKLFGNINPVGKTIYLNGNKETRYIVGGVIEDLPSTAHLKTFNFFLTLKDVVFYPGEQDNWGATNYPIYIQLKEDISSERFAQKLTEVVRKNYWIPNMDYNGNKRMLEVWSALKLHLQPIQDIHLYSSDIEDYKQIEHGDIKLVWLFGGIACFILLIACINFINLSTARSAKRAKEIGLRKTIGSYRSSLIGQFLTESTLYSLLSFLLGVAFAWLSLPLFNMLSGKSLAFPWSDPRFFPIILLAALFIGLLAGLYPALYLSAFRPISALKGHINQNYKVPVLRNGLVVFQFVTSILLIIGTLVINSQMHFILNAKIGFDKDQVMVLQGTNTLGRQVKVLRDELEKIPQVKDASISDYLPIRMDGVKRNGNGFWKEGRTVEDPSVGGQFWEIDEHFISTLGMKLVAGRNFNPAMATDSQSVIINQKLATELGLTNPIGAKITNGMVFTVIGVVEDFHFESLKDELRGLCLGLSNSTSMLSIKLNNADVVSAIPAIQTVWKKFAPDQAIRYTFLDEAYARMYSDVQRTGNIFNSFAVLAIFIACLGLFGLAAFTTEQRTKEIGIRKVLGASVKGIVQLLSKDFIRLVFVAIVIASPIAWWAMNKWLQDFTYRVSIDWWVFVYAGLAAILIALLTVSYQAIKAALSNPVDSLRNE